MNRGYLQEGHTALERQSGIEIIFNLRVQLVTSYSITATVRSSDNGIERRPRLNAASVALLLPSSGVWACTFWRLASVASPSMYNGVVPPSGLSPHEIRLRNGEAACSADARETPKSARTRLIALDCTRRSCIERTVAPSARSSLVHREDAVRLDTTAGSIQIRAGAPL